MNNYFATFANGQTITIVTKRTCAVAYKIDTPNGVVTGFSLNAKNALAAVGNLVCSVPKHDVSKGAKEMREENAKFLSACKIEIVAVS